MLNGMIKLFYGEVVKSEMQDMKNNENNKYHVNNEKIRKVHEISTQIDSLFVSLIKFVGYTMLCVLVFSINKIIGTILFMTMMMNLIYNRSKENYIKESIKSKVDEIENKVKLKDLIIANDIVNESKIIKDSKKQISILITLIFIGIVTNFNIILVTSILIVLLFTIKELYSNIK